MKGPNRMKISQNLYIIDVLVDFIECFEQEFYWQYVLINICKVYQKYLGFFIVMIPIFSDGILGSYFCMLATTSNIIYEICAYMGISMLLFQLPFILYKSYILIFIFTILIIQRISSLQYLLSLFLLPFQLVNHIIIVLRPSTLFDL